jgi:uncharacterized protein DUF4185
MSAASGGIGRPWEHSGDRSIRLPAIGAALALFAGCSGPPPSLRLVKAVEIGTVTQSVLIVGRDGGQSAIVWGQAVWAFGDTVLSIPDADGNTWHHNSYALATVPVASSTIPQLADPLDAAGAPRYLVPPTAAEAQFNAAHQGDSCQRPCGARWAAWPGAPVFDDQHHRALIPYSLIYSEPGPFNFHGVGDSIAIWSSIDAIPERPEIVPSSDHPTLIFGSEGGWTQAARIIDDFLYAFGCPQDGFGHSCQIARAPLDSIQDASAWRVWTGHDWSPRRGDAQTLFGAGPNISVFHLEPSGPWVVVYGGSGSNDVMMRTAPSLTGPWSEEERLFTAQRASGSTYDANVHPELAEYNSFVQYITFSRDKAGGSGSALAVVRVELAPR